MRNLTQLATSMFLGVCLWFAPPVLADDIEPGTSFTHKIVNPGFDNNNGNGWTITAASNIKYGYESMEAYNVTFDVRQTVKSLPPGVYRLTMNGFHRATSNDAGAAYQDNSEVINAVLFSETSLTNKETLLQSLYSVQGFEVTGAGTLANGYLNNMAAFSQAVDAGLYLNIIEDVMVGGDSLMVIGVKTVGPNVNSSWTNWDNFTLTYMGEASPGAYKGVIEGLTERLNAFYGYGIIPSGNFDEIEKAYAFRDQYATSEDLTELQAVMDSMSHVLNRAQLAADAVVDVVGITAKAAEAIGWNYPGIEELRSAYVFTVSLLEVGAVTPEGNLVFASDLQQAIVDLKEAIRVYRFTQPVEDPEVGIDLTWSVKTPDFTKEGGDSSLLADASSDGWQTDNVPAVFEQYRLGNVSGKNCWNNWNPVFTRMNVFQDMENMPAGLYSFSCYQSNDGPEMTDQHAYITGLGGTSGSPVAQYTFADNPDPDKGVFSQKALWEGPLKTGKILVGSDGKLRIGFASTSNGNGSSGWFCITDCSLIYYGMAEGAYAKALQDLIAVAGELKESTMLGTDEAKLGQAIEAAGQVDTSDPESAQAGLEALNAAISRAENAVAVLAVFKDSLNSRTEAIIANEEGHYPAEIVELIKKVRVLMINVLEADTTTTAAFSGLEATLDHYVSYAGVYIAFNEYAKQTGNTGIVALSREVLSDQNELVSSGLGNLAPAIAQFGTVRSFFETYLKFLGYVDNELYSEALRSKLQQACAAQFEVVKEDYKNAYQAEKALCAILGDTFFEENGIEPGEDAEVTSFAIVNPTVEAEDRVAPPNGWSVDSNNGINLQNTATGQHWSGEGRYFDAYLSATSGILAFTVSQKIQGIPNGTYKLVAACRGNGDGMYLFANSSAQKHYTAIPNNDAAGGEIWKTAEEDSQEKLMNGGKGYGWNWVEVDRINVFENAVTIGFTNEKEVLGTTADWNGTWFSADDFKLYWISRNYNGVENVDAVSDAPLTVFAEEGIIKVEGADTYTLHTLNGSTVSADVKLVPGIYIVKAGSRTAKVRVK